jgi:class 3 adenylate cyclase/tetratricopeptide (TPR) repeat protein
MGRLGAIDNLNETAAHVTIVFVDLVGSTDKIARIPLDDARDALDHAIDRIVERIHQLDGIVARVQGDGVMAIFGVLRSIENHAFNACYAAQNIRDDFLALATTAAPGDMTAVRIGIHSGTVLLRKQANDLSEGFDIVGVDANLAKKVEAKSPPNAALMTRETLDLAGPAVTAKFWGTEIIGGELLELFELASISLDHDLTHEFSRDHLSPLIGRRGELDHLVAKLGAASLKGTAFSIVGEAGVGKSRLLFELSKSARQFGYRIEELRGHAVQSRTPFASLRPLVLRLMQCDNASASSILAALKRTDLPRRLRNGVLELLGLDPADEEWNALEARARRVAMLDASCALVERVLGEGPLLLIAEDVHNLDAETSEFVTELRQLAGCAPLALAVTSRNAGREVALRMTGEAVDLIPLSVEESWELSGALIAGSPVAADDLARAIDHASGNPLFLQALVRELRSGRGGGATPASVTSLVQARISRLSAKAKEVMFAASILQDNFDRGTLASTVGITESTLTPLLSELDRQDLIDVRDSIDLRFRHEVFRTAAQELLLRDEKRELHRRAMLALESRLPQTPERLEWLAHHSEKAGEIDKALKHIRTACGLAVRSSSLKTVRALYAWAMKLRTGASKEAAPVLVDIAVASIDALQQSGAADEYRDALEFTIEHAAASGNRSNEALARAHMALLFWMQARYDEGREHAEIALGIARELRSLQLLALAQPHLANIEHALGNLDRAIDLHLEIVQALEGNYEKSTLGRMIIPSVRSRAFAAWFLSERGRFADAQAQIERGEAILEEVDQPYSRVLINAARGILAIRRGNPEDAVAPLEQAQKFCLAQFYAMEPCVSAWLATALTAVGKPEKAKAIASHSIDAKIYRHGGRYTWVYIHQGLAEAQFACGETDAALETIGKAIAIATESKEPIHVAQARFARGRMLAAQGDLERGIADISAALSRAEDYGLDPLARECRNELARLGRRGAGA